VCAGSEDDVLAESFVRFVNRTTAGPNTALALTYYTEQPAGCVGSKCEIQVNFASSLNNGQTWTAPQKLSDPMQLGWIAPTTQGGMVGDHISTSFLAGQQRVLNAFAVGFAPTTTGLLNEPMFSAAEKVRPGTNPMRHDPQQVNSVDPAEIPAPTTV
jgi:hypothetical protein